VISGSIVASEPGLPTSPPPKGESIARSTNHICKREGNAKSVGARDGYAEVVWGIELQCSPAGGVMQLSRVPEFADRARRDQLTARHHPEKETLRSKPIHFPWSPANIELCGFENYGVCEHADALYFGLSFMSGDQPCFF
jgi:hypothetical protein